MPTTKKRALELRLDGQTYQQIGDALGVSRQRAQQILSPPKAVRDIVITRAHGRCQGCDIGVGLSGHVHHVDADDENYNDLENLQLLCLSCHRQVHSGNVPVGKLERGVAVEVSERLRCKKCDHKWLPRTAKVFRCPKCMSFRWDEDDSA